MPVDATQLGALPILATLSSSELETVAAGAERIEVGEPGTELTRQGDFGHTVFVVLEGRAQVTVESRPVRELTVGDIFGEVAVLSSGRRTATVLALTPMVPAGIFKRDIWALARDRGARPPRDAARVTSGAAHLTRIDRGRYIDTCRYEGERMSTTLETVACCAPLSAPTPTEEETNATAELFKALGDPARVRIVNLIATARAPVCACEFNDALDLAQPTVSHHLKKLTETGLLVREQRGKWAYFSLRRDAVEKLAAVADLKGACC